MRRLDPAYQRLLEQYRRELVEIAGGSGSRLLSILARIERRMVREMAARSGAVTRGDVNRMTATINRMVLEGLPELAAWMEAEFPRGALNGLRTQAAMLKRAFAVTDWSEIPVESVRDTFRAFEMGIENRRLLQITDPAQLARWSAEWSQHWTVTVAALESRFVEGIVRRQTWTEIAASIRGRAGTLNIEGRLNADDFARAFTRTKLTEIANVAGVRAAQAAGLTQFVNLGIPDDRQSDICRAASEAGAMTLDEWDASEWGRPTRHVFNCRCDLVAIPQFAEEKVLS